VIFIFARARHGTRTFDLPNQCLNKPHDAQSASKFLQAATLLEKMENKSGKKSLPLKLDFRGGESPTPEKI
jgi:hypothetical protein